MQAIILAAGMGRRLGDLTKENTKCMVPVNGVRLIDRLLGQLSGLSLKRVIIVVGYQGQKLRAIWEEFEEGKTPEARFAHTLDNVQPAMLNRATGGRMWREHQVRLSQILNRNKNTADGSAVLWDYSYNHFIRPHVESGEIIGDV